VKKTLTHNKILNVEANKLATEALSLKKIHNKNPSLATASILINELLVTSDYKRVLRRSFLSMDIRDYMEKKIGVIQSLKVFGGKYTKHQ
jgi:hypothetical protein